MTVSHDIGLVSYVKDIPAVAVTRPFVAADTSGILWVVKAIDPDGSHLWRDFVGSSLARWLGLPWPEIAVGRLSDDLRFFAEKRLGEVPAASCLLSRYIDGLEPIDYGLEPYGRFTSNDPFLPFPRAERLEIVAKSLAPLLDQPGNLHAIYGRAIFDNWLVERDPMMDMLQVNSQGKFVCLDASTALNLLPETERVFRSIAPHCIHYMTEGLTLVGKSVITEKSPFLPWVSRLRQFTSVLWDEIVARCPFRPPRDMHELRSQTIEVDAFLQHCRLLGGVAPT